MRSTAIVFLLTLACAGSSLAGDYPSPQEILDSFVFSRDDLAIELVLSEPAVSDPVDIAWDEAGRMYVVEMTDYPTGPGAGRIKLLEDRDADGSYETVSVFADDLPFPTSVLPSRGGVYGAAAPNLWYLKDQDGDGKADGKDVVVTGFAEGNQQLRVNGLSWGLDNWIYGANGRSAGSIRTPAMKDSEAIPLRARDFRFNPRTGVLEATSGMSQFGQAHDDFGRRFLSWNTIPIRQALLEQRYVDRMPAGIVANPVADISNPDDGNRLYPIAAPQKRFNRESVEYFNASCGLTIYRGDLLPSDLQGNAFICEPLSSLVHRKEFIPNGSALLAKRADREKEFLTSTHPWFRPVNLETGPDGALYIVDFAREWVEHPDFVPENLRNSVDYRIGSDLGRIWRIVPKPESTSSPIEVHHGVRPVHESPQQLVELLGHPNGWVRDTCQRLLVERGDASLWPLLRARFESTTDARCRVHCLWTLEGLGALEEETLLAALSDPSPQVRRQALTLAEMRGVVSEAVRERILKLAADENPEVKLQLALSTAVLSASDRLGVCKSLCLSASIDDWFRWALLAAVGDIPAPFLETLTEADPFWRTTQEEGRLAFLLDLGTVAGTRNESGEIERFLRVAYCESQTELSEGNLALLAGLAEGLPGARAEVFLRRSGDPLRTEPAGPFPSQQAFIILDSPESSDLKKKLAIRLLARLDPENARRGLVATLSGDSSYGVQMAAAKALAGTLNRDSASELFRTWEDLPSSARRLLLGKMVSSATLAEMVLTALEENLLSSSELDLAQRQALRDRPEAAIRDRAEKQFGQSANPDRQKVVDRYTSALAIEDTSPEHGAELFLKNCAVCHRLLGNGKRVGPDLSGIGSQPKEKTLVAILDPSREVAPDFHQYLIETYEGDLYTGLLAAETDSALILKQADEIETRVPRQEVKEFRASQMSMMPEGFEAVFKEQDLADLIGYLYDPVGATR